MIRVCKSPTEPATLASKGYKDDAVRTAIDADQDGKCYLCEREMGTDMQVEHLKSQKHAAHLKNVWTNLFLACSYCNGKKLENYDGILDPTGSDIEKLIRHRYDSAQDEFVFLPTDDHPTAEVSKTINLLNLIFNGAKPGLSTIKERKFKRQFQSAYVAFNDCLSAYLKNPCSNTRQKVADALSHKAEFLGFKYWIILSSPVLAQEFKTEIIWNKK